MLAAKTVGERKLVRFAKIAKDAHRSCAEKPAKKAEKLGSFRKNGKNSWAQSYALDL
jgi:hypothetical protein